MVVAMSECKADREDVRVHLQMMQSVITRMADNSRACKTWAVTLVAAILVVVARFGGADSDSAFGAEVAWIAAIPTILFWVLDSYYLALERAFRTSYSNFVKRLHNGKLEPSAVFTIAPTGSVPRYVWDCQRSFAIWPFYPVMLVVIGAFWWLLG